jgi:hypothetical protein
MEMISLKYIQSFSNVLDRALIDGMKDFPHPIWSKIWTAQLSRRIITERHLLADVFLSDFEQRLDIDCQACFDEQFITLEIKLYFDRNKLGLKTLNHYLNKKLRQEKKYYERIFLAMSSERICVPISFNPWWQFFDFVTQQEVVNFFKRNVFSYVYVFRSVSINGYDYCSLLDLVGNIFSCNRFLDLIIPEINIPLWGILLKEYRYQSMAEEYLYRPIQSGAIAKGNQTVLIRFSDSSVLEVNTNYLDWNFLLGLRYPEEGLLDLIIKQIEHNNHVFDQTLIPLNSLTRIKKETTLIDEILAGIMMKGDGFTVSPHNNDKLINRGRRTVGFNRRSLTPAKFFDLNKLYTGHKLRCYDFFKSIPFIRELFNETPDENRKQELKLRFSKFYKPLKQIEYEQKKYEQGEYEQEKYELVIENLYELAIGHWAELITYLDEIIQYAEILNLKDRFLFHYIAIFCEFLAEKEEAEGKEEADEENRKQGVIDSDAFRNHPMISETSEVSARNFYIYLILMDCLRQLFDCLKDKRKIKFIGEMLIDIYLQFLNLCDEKLFEINFLEEFLNSGFMLNQTLSYINSQTQLGHCVSFVLKNLLQDMAVKVANNHPSIDNIRRAIQLIYQRSDTHINEVVSKFIKRKDCGRNITRSDLDKIVHDSTNNFFQLKANSPGSGVGFHFQNELHP